MTVCLSRSSHKYTLCCILIVLIIWLWVFFILFVSNCMIIYFIRQTDRRKMSISGKPTKLHTENVIFSARALRNTRILFDETFSGAQNFMYNTLWYEKWKHATKKNHLIFRCGMHVHFCTYKMRHFTRELEYLAGISVVSLVQPKKRIGSAFFFIYVKSQEATSKETEIKSRKNNKVLY